MQKKVRLSNSVSTVVVTACTGAVLFQVVLVQVDGVLRKENYLQIPQLHLKSTSGRLKLGHNWMFQQDKDPKYT